MDRRRWKRLSRDGDDDTDSVAAMVIFSPDKWRNQIILIIFFIFTSPARRAKVRRNRFFGACEPRGSQRRIVRSRQGQMYLFLL